MLAEEPQWTFASKGPLTQWYGHVCLLSDHVVGQWFCLTRESGELLWQRRFYRANDICGIDPGVIVASEMRSDGPWTCDFGCYGISLRSGSLLWVSHHNGLWGRFVRLLDYVPFFTNELRDTPHHVKSGKVFCDSGRVLDVRTGRQLAHVPAEEVTSYKAANDPARQLYDTADVVGAPKVEIAPNQWLSHPGLGQGEFHTRGVWQIYLEDENGRRIWSFDLKDTGQCIDGNYYSYRLVAPYIYLVVSEEPRYKPHPSGERHVVVPNPTRWRLMTLDTADGKIVQDFPLSDERLEECRIEDADPSAVLVSDSRRRLRYYPSMRRT